MKLTSTKYPDLNSLKICLHHLIWFSCCSSERAWGTHNVHSFLTDNCSETIRYKVDFGMCRSSSNCLYMILLLSVIAFQTASTDWSSNVRWGSCVWLMFKNETSSPELYIPAFNSSSGRTILTKLFRHFFHTPCKSRHSVSFKLWYLTLDWQVRNRG